MDEDMAAAEDIADAIRDLCKGRPSRVAMAAMGIVLGEVMNNYPPAIRAEVLLEWLRALLDIGHE